MNVELERVVAEQLDEQSFELVELRHGGTRSRPVLEVRIDRRDGQKVTVDDCARASRALEAKLDGTRAILSISDDGRGIDIEAVHRRAIEIGAISEKDSPRGHSGSLWATPRRCCESALQTNRSI